MTESIIIKVPIEMLKYLNCVNPEMELTRNVLLNQTMSHGEVTKILAIKNPN